jgi:hypothetical protein
MLTGNYNFLWITMASQQSAAVVDAEAANRAGRAGRHDRSQIVGQARR